MNDKWARTRDGSWTKWTNRFPQSVCDKGGYKLRIYTECERVSPPWTRVLYLIDFCYQDSNTDWHSKPSIETSSNQQRIFMDSLLIALNRVRNFQSQQPNGRGRGHVIEFKLKVKSLILIQFVGCQREHLFLKNKPSLMGCPLSKPTFLFLWISRQARQWSGWWWNKLLLVKRSRLNLSSCIESCSLVAFAFD